MTDPSGPKKSIQDYTRYSAIGMQFALTFLVFGAIGYFLDGWLGTQPWLLITGIFVGAAGGFLSMYRTIFPPKKGDGKQGKKPK